ALKTVKAVFQFTVGEGTLTIPRAGKELELTASNGTFVIKGGELQAFVKMMLDSLQGYSPDKKLLPVSVESTSIKLTPVSPTSPDDKKPTHAVKEITIGKPVKFEFAYVLHSPEAAPPQPAPQP